MSNKTEITVLESCIPTVEIHPDALTKMMLYTEKHDEEIGWLGVAYKNEKDNTIYIEDVFLFEQQTHQATTEISPDGLAEFGEKLLESDNGMEIWNNLKVWGHSHVNGNTSPSKQDDKQMETFSESGHNWFIRIITNKKNTLRVDLYEFSQGIIYNNLKWEEVIDEKEEELINKINELHQELENIREKRKEKYEEDIEKEIKNKVEEKYIQRNLHNHNYLGYHGSYPSLNDKKKEEIEEEFFNYNSTIFQHLDSQEVMDIGEAVSLKEVKKIFESCGYHNIDDNEAIHLWDICKDFVIKYYGMIY